MEKVRINKFLANLGIDSRRAIDQMIEQGRITVNGKMAESGIKVDSNDEIFIDGKSIKKDKSEKVYFMLNKPQKVLSAVKDDRGAESGIKVDSNDEIFIDGKSIKKDKSEKVYFMLNKPQKVLSAVKDDRGRKLVVDLIKTDERIFPIGRLDYDTEGLIILTNDGEIYNRVIHPRGEVYKTYYVEVIGTVSLSTLNRLKKGVLLDDKMTLPARGKIISSTPQFTTLKLRDL